MNQLDEFTIERIIEFVDINEFHKLFFVNKEFEYLSLRILNRFHQWDQTLIILNKRSYFGENIHNGCNNISFSHKFDHIGLRCSVEVPKEKCVMKFSPFVESKRWFNFVLPLSYQFDEEDSFVVGKIQLPMDFSNDSKFHSYLTIKVQSKQKDDLIIVDLSNLNKIDTFIEYENEITILNDSVLNCFTKTSIILVKNLPHFNSNFFDLKIGNFASYHQNLHQQNVNQNFYSFRLFTLNDEDSHYFDICEHNLRKILIPKELDMEKFRNLFKINDTLLIGIKKNSNDSNYSTSLVIFDLLKLKFVAEYPCSFWFCEQSQHIHFIDKTHLLNENEFFFGIFFYQNDTCSFKNHYFVLNLVNFKLIKVIPSHLDDYVLTISSIFEKNGKAYFRFFHDFKCMQSYGAVEMIKTKETYLPIQ